MHEEKLQASFLDNLLYDLRAAQGNSTKATMLNSIYGRLVQANARAFIARSISEATTMDLLDS